MPSLTTLPLNSDETKEPPRAGNRGTLLLLVVLLLVLLGALAFLAYRVQQRMGDLERAVAALSVKAEDASTQAARAMERATGAEAGARAAAEARQAAEAKTASALEETATARQEADAARQEATSARETAAAAEAEAAGIRRRAEAEVNRLEEALGQIAETRHTALGLVMNLGSDHLKFEFDKAELRAGDRELLSRIAGILMTSHDYTVSVNGHTDDVGSDAYNQTLSERRAEAVRDYLVQAGLPAEIFTVEGHGKMLPLVPGKSEAARAKNRRVELGIVNTQIRFMR